MQDLGTLGWDPSDASGINDLGIVVGNSRKDPNTTRAFIWLSSLGMFDMGTLGGVGSAATDINNSFQAVGGAQTASGADHAFLWDFGGMHDLGTLTGTDSVAYAINNKGDIVGSSARSAFLYQNGIMKDLNNVIAGQGWNLTVAWDINERGDIVGEGTHHGLRRAWLLENNEPEGNLGQAIIAAVTQILFGVIDDRGGLVIPPGRGPTPVPPHGPVWRSLSPGKREILLSLALDEVALRLKDQKTGRQVRGIALKTALREVKRMLDRLPKS